MTTLTDDEIKDFWQEIEGYVNFARAIIAADRAKQAEKQEPVAQPVIALAGPDTNAAIAQQKETP